MPETLNPAVAELADAVDRYRFVATRFERTRPSDSRTSITEREALRYLSTAAARDEPRTPKQLGEHLGITTPSTTSLLDRLEGSGFLTRVPNPTDRRSSYVHLTRVHRTETTQTPSHPKSKRSARASPPQMR
jgi:DNA-binding MarR family transcriptional regulator